VIKQCNNSLGIVNKTTHQIQMDWGGGKWKQRLEVFTMQRLKLQTAVQYFGKIQQKYN